MSPRRGFLEGRGFVWFILIAHSAPKSELFLTVKSTFYLPMWERSNVTVSSSNIHPPLPLLHIVGCTMTSFFQIPEDASPARKALRRS